MEEIEILRYPQEFKSNKLDTATAFGYLVLAEYKFYEYHIKANIKHYVEHLEYNQSNFYIEDINYMSKRNDTYIYILKYRDKFCGYIIFKKDGIDSDTVYISQLYINIEARRMGFAKLLLCKVEEVAKKIKRNIVYLDVAKVNKEAITLYEFCDYKKSSYQLSGDWSYEYKKEL